MKIRTILIDGDMLLWKACYHNRDELDSSSMKVGLDNTVKEILINTQADMYCGFLKGRVPSHRHQMFSDYKGNRPEAPIWYKRWKPEAEQHLVESWGFACINGIEVDDAIASQKYILENLMKQEYEIIICSEDKDFNQLDGLHYNPKEKTTVDITKDKALLFLHSQYLTGDSTDNIKGIPGIGPAKALKLLSGVSTEMLTETVLGEYIKFNEGDLARGLLDFSENVVKITLKVDKSLELALNEAPKTIKQIDEFPL